MQYALVDGNKIQAQKGLEGICPHCEKAVRARCGEIKIHHWYHHRAKKCDDWKGNETEWHLTWKNLFPIDHVEQKIEKGSSYHIADVFTNDGVVIEFQNSPLSVTTLKRRESFYEKMIWVVNSQPFKSNFSTSKLDIHDTQQKPDNLYQGKDDEDNKCWIYDLGKVNPDKELLLALNSVGMNYDRFSNKAYLYLGDGMTIRKSAFKMFNGWNARLKIHSFEKNTYYFKWTYPHRHWIHAEMPVFIDTNDGYLHWIKRWTEKNQGFTQRVSLTEFLSKYSLKTQSNTIQEPNQVKLRNL